MSTKIVRIKTAGCDIYPHDHLFVVKEKLGNVYPTLDGSDRINADWCEEYTPEEADKHSMVLFGNKTFESKGITLNEFRRRGYFSDGSKTGFFKQDEYNEYEKYLLENKLVFLP